MAITTTMYVASQISNFDDDENQTTLSGTRIRPPNEPPDGIKKALLELTLDPELAKQLKPGAEYTVIIRRKRNREPEKTARPDAV